MAGNNTKRCPYCNEIINEFAKKCKHCGEWLDSEKPGKATTIIEAFSSLYEIQGELGRGGMAIVYKARQKSLDRTVALKIIPRDFHHDKDFIERFKREAIATSKLKHPNIITIYDSGEVYGYPYMAMDYLEGRTLADRLRDNERLTEEEVKDILIPVLRGLQYAHEKGIIHRDIKSSNIMFDEKNTPVLMDFGIAKTFFGPKLTRDGTYMGTPEYSSPEQSDSEKEVDSRTDIYSIAVVAYEMILGRVPFGGTNPVSILHDVIHKQPTYIGNLNPSLSKGFCNAIMRALSKDPGERYENCQLFENALIKGESKSYKPVEHRIDKPEPEKKIVKKKVVESQLVIDNQKILLYLIIFLSLVIGGTLIYYFLKNPQNKPKAVIVSEKPTSPVQNNTISNTQTTAQQNVQTGQQISTEKPATTNSTSVTVPRDNRPYLERLGIEMVAVSGGEFDMGSYGTGDGDEQPVHRVRISSFYISRHEITQAQWQEVMGSNPSYRGSCPNCPVENVSWNDVMKFLQELTRKSERAFRLPTEAEWEFAARGGNSSAGFTYSGHNDPNPVAWFEDNSNNRPQAVGRKMANELGLYDMSGNVREWCSDWYDNNYYTACASLGIVVDPRGPSGGRSKVTRGGSFYHSRFTLRNTDRISENQGLSDSNIGFRIVSSN